MGECGMPACHPDRIASQTHGGVWNSPSDVTVPLLTEHQRLQRGGLADQERSGESWISQVVVPRCSFLVLLYRYVERTASRPVDREIYAKWNGTSIVRYRDLRYNG